MLKTGRQALALALFWAFCLTVALSQPAEGLPLVDYRMAPLEQVKKLHAAQRGSGPTMTVMKLRTTTTDGDYAHLVLTDVTPLPVSLPSQLAQFDGVSWNPGPGGVRGACDSTPECEDKTDDMCNAAGHIGVKVQTVQITLQDDGSKTCSGDCQTGGAIAFVTCGGVPNCIRCD